MPFERLVFWSGVWNVGLGLSLVSPPITSLFGVRTPNPFWPWLDAGFLWYASETLIASSRDVRGFASIVNYEALLRFFPVGMLIIHGVTYIGATPAALFAATDFAWGVVYVVGLRRLTGRTHASLLLGRDR